MYFQCHCHGGGRCLHLRDQMLGDRIRQAAERLFALEPASDSRVNHSEASSPWTSWDSSLYHVHPGDQIRGRPLMTKGHSLGDKVAAH
jgi:hypothetical protein